MSPSQFLRRRGAIGTLALVLISPLTACGGGGGGTSGGAVAVTMPTPTPTPTPSPTPSPSQYTTTLVPFQLTQSRDLDVFGWDAWPSAPVASTIQMRWDAVGVGYEMVASVFGERGFLKLLASQKSYDVLTASGTKLPFSVVLEAPAGNGFAFRYIGDARIFDSGARAFVAFGIGTTAGDMPAAGLRICDFGMDEIGSGRVTIDLATGAVSGFVEPFNFIAGTTPPQFPIQATYSPGATTLGSTYGSNAANVLDARFYGPQAAEIAVRTKGQVSGIMLGTCHG